MVAVTRSSINRRMEDQQHPQGQQQGQEQQDEPSTKKGPQPQPEILIRVLSKDCHKKFVQRIRVHPDLSMEEFERCIALNAYGNEDCVNRHVYALFREFDGTSISLSEILGDPSQFQGEIMTVLHPSEEEAFSIPGKDRNAAIDGSNQRQSLLPRMYIFIRDGIIVSVFALFAYKAWTSHDFLENFNERALLSMIMTPVDLIDYAVEHPLRWIYRNGPPIVGWDGISYPEICAAIVPDITGIDKAFWFNNIDRCKILYTNRERAMLSKMKPLSYLFYSYILFKLFMHWITVKAKTKPDPR